MSFHPPGVMPVREHLENGAKLNPHGFGGVLLLPGETMTMFRSLDAGEAIGWFCAERDKHPQAYALFHSRYATGSPVTEENCHPLEVGGDPATVVAHNGLMFHVEPAEGSDTRVFAGQILPNYDLRNWRQRLTLERRMGPNKAVVFSSSPQRDAVTLLNSHLGVWAGDVWHSNADYTGSGHICPGRCGTCGTKVGPEEIICPACDAAAGRRRALLLEAS